MDITITPDNWTSIDSFTVDWTDPPELSGLKKGAFYYVGLGPPSAQENGTWVSKKPFEIKDVPEGESKIYLWLEDSLKHTNYLNYSTATLRLDRTAPVISHVPVEAGLGLP